MTSPIFTDVMQKLDNFFRVVQRNVLIELAATNLMVWS